MKEFGIILNFKDKMITIDEIILPMRNINNLQGASILRVLKQSHSLAMEPHFKAHRTLPNVQRGSQMPNIVTQISSQLSGTIAST
jgi:hypothetical protein